MCADVTIVAGKRCVGRHVVAGTKRKVFWDIFPGSATGGCYWAYCRWLYHSVRIMALGKPDDEVRLHTVLTALQVFWSLSAVQAGLLLFSFLAYSESHAPTILKKRARHFRKTTGNLDFYTAAERLEDGQTIAQILGRSLSRPLRLLAFHPIIQFISVLQGFSYGCLYLVLSFFANLWIQDYHESISTSGLHYFALAIGELLAAEIGGPLMDLVFRKLKARKNGEVSPEFRAPMILPGALIAPIGFAIYGWTAQIRAPWPLVDLGMVILAFGLQLQGTPLQAYIIDAYPDHAGSATAASQLLRSLAAFAFPLFAPRMYNKLGYGWGNTLLAFVAGVLFVPAPWVLWKFGPSMRERAKSSH